MGSVLPATRHKLTCPAKPQPISLAISQTPVTLPDHRHGTNALCSVAAYCAAFTDIHCAIPRRVGLAQLIWAAGYIPTPRLAVTRPGTNGAQSTAICYKYTINKVSKYTECSSETETVDDNQCIITQPNWQVYIIIQTNTNHDCWIHLPGQTVQVERCLVVGCGQETLQSQRRQD